jgi:predicted RNA-binding Zn-ribbon protein involved in translation (DUF1610 family)
MRLISTGSLVRSFQCPECHERKIVKREFLNLTKAEEDV